MWAPIGQQACVPIMGSHDRRFLTGILNIKTGDYIDARSDEFHQEHFQTLLVQMRRHWRGWHIVLFLDRNSPHTADASQELAHDLGIQLRWLPKACSELNVMDQLYLTPLSRPFVLENKVEQVSHSQGVLIKAGLPYTLAGVR
jgi:hypothetical protein